MRSVRDATPNLAGQKDPFDEGDSLSSKGPSLNLLVEINPEPRRSRNEVTYEIASDVWSPTMTVSSIGAGVSGEPEEEYDIDMSSFHPSEPVRMHT